jgi:hypothetical protein
MFAPAITRSFPTILAPVMRTFPKWFAQVGLLICAVAALNLRG